jgi:hypothetical protein
VLTRQTTASFVAGSGGGLFNDIWEGADTVSTGSTNIGTPSGSISGSVGSQGSGNAFPILNPCLVVNKIIKT